MKIIQGCFGTSYVTEHCCAVILILLYFLVPGYQTSNATFTAIVMRYSDRDGFIHFDDFSACIIKLKSMFGKHLSLLNFIRNLCTGTYEKIARVSKLSLQI